MTDERSKSVFPKLALGVIWGYKKIVSPWLPAACRFVPTCSEYASQAVEKYGVIRGSGKALTRLSRCHPLHSGGVDLLD